MSQNIYTFIKCVGIPFISAKEAQKLSKMLLSMVAEFNSQIRVMFVIYNSQLCLGIHIRVSHPKRSQFLFHKTKGY